MKIINIILSIILCIGGCTGYKQSTDPTDNFIKVDVTGKYPNKELILQDFMDVEYVPLETTDEFVCQGLVSDISKNFIVVRNRNDDGNIFIFDRSGKGIKKINRKGQAGGEYTYISGITLDEDRDEMFINEHLARKIHVYDLDGNFKRNLQHNGSARYTKIYNFDDENLICHDGTINEQSFSIISKLDGTVIKNIHIPFSKKIIASVISKDKVNNISYSARLPYEPIIPYYNNYIISESSSDTTYIYSSDHKMTPFIVRTPLIQSMTPEVFLFPSIITDSYYFMEIIKKEYDFATQQGFPSISLMYDRKEKAISKYTIYNDDYVNKRQVFMNTRPVNGEIATWQNLAAYRLVSAYKNGHLKGKLREIAATLDEDSNSVIMLIKHKKQT